jgi:hypothetical protein
MCCSPLKKGCLCVHILSYGPQGRRFTSLYKQCGWHWWTAVLVPFPGCGDEVPITALWLQCYTQRNREANLIVGVKLFRLCASRKHKFQTLRRMLKYMRLCADCFSFIPSITCPELICVKGRFVPYMSWPHVGEVVCLYSGSPSALGGGEWSRSGSGRNLSYLAK